MLSPSTRSFDHLQKRSAYLRRGAAEYWLVDPDQRDLLQIRPGVPDQRHTGDFTWSPSLVAPPLELSISAFFTAL